MMLLTVPVSALRLRSAIIGALLGFCISEPLLAAQSPQTTSLNLSSGEAIYGAQQAAGGSDAGPGGETGGGQKKNGASGENVVDADFEEVKDDKKKSA